MFIVLPDMLKKAPIFSRIKLWRKFKGHAVFGSGEVIGPARGQSAAIIQKSRERRMQVEGMSRGGGPPQSRPSGGSNYGPGGGGGSAYGPAGGSYGPGGGGGSRY